MVDFHDALARARTIAVVGCSARPSRTSHGIARYLQRSGYRMIPVNPNYEEVLGERCYPSLERVPEDAALDIVNVFRAPRHTAGVVRDVVARSRTTDERPLVWTQLGVSTLEAERLAEEAGLPYVANRCIMVEHGRMR